MDFWTAPGAPPERRGPDGAPTIHGSTAQDKAIKVQDVGTRHDLKGRGITTACLNNWEIRRIYIY